MLWKRVGFAVVVVGGVCFLFVLNKIALPVIAVVALFGFGSSQPQRTYAAASLADGARLVATGRIECGQMGSDCEVRQFLQFEPQPGVRQPLDTLVNCPGAQQHEEVNLSSARLQRRREATILVLDKAIFYKPRGKHASGWRSWVAARDGEAASFVERRTKTVGQHISLFPTLYLIERVDWKRRRLVMRYVVSHGSDSAPLAPRRLAFRSAANAINAWAFDRQSTILLNARKSRLRS